MIRAILALVGIVMIILGSIFEISEVTGWGFIITMPAAFTLLFKVVKGLNHSSPEAPVPNPNGFYPGEEEEWQQNQINEQKNLTERYKNSELTKQLISYICNGSPEYSIPKKILIYDNRVEADLHGNIRVFDFASRRIHSLPSVVKVVRSKEALKYVVRPQLAMAEAINCNFADRYVISESANLEYDVRTDSDGDSYMLITYSSNKYTILTLKDTLPNQSF